MGAYLSTPVREKISTDCESECLKYGASSMQGWRVSQEDDHNTIGDYDVETNTSYFAVYDGHGGAEVAQYTAQHLPEFLKQLSAYKEGRLAQALEDAFLDYDKTLTTEDVISELKEIAGVTPNELDKAEAAEETKHLVEEATMPLQQLMERYGGGGGACSIAKLRKKEGAVAPSPALRAKKVTTDDNVSSSLSNGSSNGVNGAGDAANNKDPVRLRLDADLLNGHSENENNENTERERHMLKHDDDNEAAAAVSNTSTMKTTENEADKNKDTEISPKVEAEANTVKDESPSSSTDPTQSTETEKKVPSNKQEAQSSSDVTPTTKESVSASSSDPSTTTSNECEGSSKMEPDCSSAKSSGSSARRGKALQKSSKPNEDDKPVEGDSDDDDVSGDSEEEWMGRSLSDSEDEDEDGDEDGSDEEDSEDEEDEDDEDEDGPVMGCGEEPGSDSGCTAVVAVLRGLNLYVANAGDSRCVVSRAGKAIDMSVDHKPEDDLERTRINKAGGRVTLDGRVNGGLNLSRALGDHCYKLNTTLDAKEQMITALPDVRCLTLEENDEFMVLACDGIWNVMTSQEVVDFVLELMKAGTDKLSTICEHIFDYCLSPNTDGDGTGCDNMTCVLVTFNHDKLQAAASVNLKRRASNGEMADITNCTEVKKTKTDSSADKQESACKTDLTTPTPSSTHSADANKE